MLTVQARNNGISLSEESKAKWREMVRKADEIRDKKTLEENYKVDNLEHEEIEKKY